MLLCQTVAAVPASVHRARRGDTHPSLLTTFPIVSWATHLGRRDAFPPEQWRMLRGHSCPLWRCRRLGQGSRPRQGWAGLPGGGGPRAGLGGASGRGRAPGSVGGASGRGRGVRAEPRRGGRGPGGVGGACALTPACRRGRRSC